MAKLLLLVALVLQCVSALQLPVRAAAHVGRCASPEMKHKDYFTRVARAESGRLRLCVTRSNNHIYGQIIDDSKDAVVAAASTMEKELRESDDFSTASCAGATAVGKLLAEKAKAKGIEKVFFDRKGKPYHGRVAALADGAREGGLSF